MDAYGAGSASSSVAERVKFWLFRDMMRAGTVLQAWSRWAKQSAIDDYGIPAAKIIVNPPGVDLDFWKPVARSATAGDGSPMRVLFIGGDFQRKGGPLLLEWYKGQDPARCELHIVTREAVDGGAGVHVYHDVQPNSQQLLQLCQNSDVFVLPSLGECFGIATVEAMATGLPVIITDVGAAADIVEPGRNGFAIPSGDSRALEQACAVLMDGDRRRQMACQARQMAEERFNLRTNARRTFGLLEQMAAKGDADRS
jgi:glycosyltransferase involved in cell wall biosynthesis